MMSSLRCGSSLHARWILPTSFETWLLLSSCGSLLSIRDVSLKNFTPVSDKCTHQAPVLHHLSHGNGHLDQDSRLQCLCLQDCETLLEIILTIKCFTFSGFLCFHRKSLSMRKSGKFYLAIGRSDFVVTMTMHIAQAFVMPNIKWIWKSLQVPSAAHLQRSWNRNDIKNRGENSQICCMGGSIWNIT